MLTLFEKKRLSMRWGPTTWLPWKIGLSVEWFSNNTPEITIILNTKWYLYRRGLCMNYRLYWLIIYNCNGRNFSVILMLCRYLSHITLQIKWLVLTCDQWQEIKFIFPFMYHWTTVLRKQNKSGHIFYAIPNTSYPVWAHTILNEGLLNCLPLLVHINPFSWFYKHLVWGFLPDYIILDISGRRF